MTETSTSIPKVFVVNLYAHDFTKAALFGELVPITEGRVNFLRHHEVIVKAVEVIKNQSTKDDFLLLSGHNLLCGICVAVWFQVHSQARLLVYDMPNKKYVIRDVSKSHIDSKLNEINGGIHGIDESKEDDSGAVGC